MKLTAIILLAACLQLSATGLSQNITITMKNAPLQKVFGEIKRQTGFQFFYKDALLKQAGTVNIEVKDAALEEVLKACFSNLTITYTIVDQTIIVKEKVSVPALKELPPPVKVTGLVKNENNEPVAGASINIKGGKTAALTDANGYFELNAVNDNAVLIISGTNIETTEIRIAGRTALAITVKIKVATIDEVQVIGYGTTTKRLKTGAVSSLKAETIEKQPVTNVFQAMQGRVPGVSITQSYGAIGSTVDIQIRGVNTIQAGRNPLIIIDGAIVPSAPMLSNRPGQYISNNGTNPFNSINPADIESMEVLKDADATAIYGSRGANGVILITSKKAKLGATRFTIDASTGINEATYITPRLNLQQYLQMRKDAFAMGNYDPATGVAINPITPTAGNAADLLVWDQDAYTDWGKYEFGKKAGVYNIQANLSGGNKMLNFYASAGYLKQNDITPGDPHQERISGHLNVNHTSANDRLKVSLNTNYSVDGLYPSKGHTIGAAGITQSLPPNMPLYNPDGSYYWPTTAILQNAPGYLFNPAAIETGTRDAVTNNFVANLDVGYRIYKGIGVKAQIGYNNQQVTSATTLPSTATNPYGPLLVIPESRSSQIYYKSFNVEPQLTYSGSIAKGRIEALLGSTFYSKDMTSYTLVLQGYTSDLLLNSWAAANTVASKSSAYANYRFNSVFGRINYNWDNKYLVNLSFRRDGSSRFGPEKQWADFGAIGLGWLFSNESFLQNSLGALSYGKLRGSYGTTGNDDIPDYRFASLFTSNNVVYNGSTGLLPAYLTDPSFSWESSKKWDLALELGFLKDRILLNIDWYKTRSYDLLVNIPVASQTNGFTSYLSNFPGVVENKGWEFELTTNNLNATSKLSWKTSVNLNLLQNRLASFPGLAQSSYNGKMEIGHPVPATDPILSLMERAYVIQGIDPATGLPQIKDVNKDGTFNNSLVEKEYIGSTIPRTYGGVGNTFSYKGFSLDIFCQFSRQLCSNWLFLINGAPGQIINPAADLYGNYWKQPGDKAKYPRLFSGAAANSTTPLMNAYPLSSDAVKDLLFVRLKNLSLSYSLPQVILSKAKLTKVTVYLRGQNLATYTSAKIYKDPESVRGAAPLIKSWTAGMQVTL